jgi:hypothetical protein
MSLRKSPRRTRALLVANRRNSRKSTGPRTAAGKRHSAWNAVRHGRRAHPSYRCIPVARRELKTFMDFYCKLHDAIIPAESLVGEQAVLAKALEAWKVKRILDRWIETRTEEDWPILAARAAPLPSFWRLRLRRPGLSVPNWTVTISVWLRWGRGPDQREGLSRRAAAEDNERRDRPRMHTMVSVHSTGPSRDVARASSPCGSRPELALSKAKGWPCHDPGEVDSERTKPESDTIQRGFLNMSLPADWDPAYAEAYALAERIVGWLMGLGKRTKPESHRNQQACKNMSPAGESAAQNPDRSDKATTIERVFGAMKTAFTARKECLQLPLFQAKPECLRKGGAYENMSKGMSKIRVWLGPARSLLPRRGSNRPPIPPISPRAAQAGCEPSGWQETNI